MNRRFISIVVLSLMILMLAAGVAFAATLVGTGKSEFIAGTARADSIYGRAGADSIRGSGGNDAIHGGWGADIIYAGPGEDTVYGSRGNDRIHVEDDDAPDNVRCGSGFDRVFFGGDGDEAVDATCESTVTLN